MAGVGSTSTSTARAPHAANAGDQRALQHFTAQARISPHKDGGAMHVAGQHIGAGLPQAESKVTGEFRVGDAARTPSVPNSLAIQWLLSGLRPKKHRYSCCHTSGCP